MTLWHGLENSRQVSKARSEGRQSEDAPPHLQPPPPLTQQEAPPLEVPIALKILRFIPNGWCGSYRGVGPLVANSHGDRDWG